ncbi:COG1361 S-layer family protein [Halarchaeum acidiphilum]|nr:CARDB domain-containing protein [Halarchaeum acidiphilum]
MTRDRRLGVALVALLLVGASAFGVVSVSAANKTVAGHPDLHASVTDNEFTTGTEATLDLYVQNDGVLTQGGAAEYQERVKTARSTQLSISGGSSPITVHTKQYPAGNIVDGTNGPYSIKLTVPEGTKPGTYYLNVRAQYKYTGAVNYDPEQPEYVDYQQTKTFRVPVVVRDRATFSVVNSTTNAQVNQRGTYNVTVKNTGSEVATNVVAEATSGTDALTFGSTGQSASTSVATWEPGETKTLSYSAAIADTTSVRDYSVPLHITFADADGVTREANRLVSTLRPKPEQDLDVGHVDSDLRVGTDGNVSVVVSNDGPVAIDHATVRLATSDDAITPQRDEYALGRLGVGDVATVTFPVEVSDSAESGPRQFDFTVSYKNQFNDSQQSDPLPATVPVAAERDRFVVEPVNGTLSAGGSGTVRFHVTNNGDRPVTNVNAKVYADDPISTGDDEAFVSSLAPGETETIAFSFAATGSALSKTYPVSMDFQYDDTDGETKLSDYYQVPLAVHESGGSGGPPLGLIGGIVVLLLVVGGGYVYYKRR